MCEHSNEKHAEWGEAALDAFKAVVGSNDDYKLDIGDLVCDLRHLCDREGVSWQSILDSVEMHYTAEVDGRGRAGDPANLAPPLPELVKVKFDGRKSSIGHFYEIETELEATSDANASLLLHEAGYEMEHGFAIKREGEDWRRANMGDATLWRAKQ